MTPRLRSLPDWYKFYRQNVCFRGESRLMCYRRARLAIQNQHGYFGVPRLLAERKLELTAGPFKAPSLNLPIARRMSPEQYAHLNEGRRNWDPEAGDPKEDIRL